MILITLAAWTFWEVGEYETYLLATSTNWYTTTTELSFWVGMKVNTPDSEEVRDTPAIVA